MKKLIPLFLVGGVITLLWKAGWIFPSVFHFKTSDTTPSPVPTSTLDPLLLEFENRYRTPLEAILGLSNDYGFEYDYQFRMSYKSILNGDYSLANILRHGKGVCQQFAVLSLAGIENKGYQAGIMVLLSKVYSDQPFDSDHEIMVFRKPGGLWGYTSNEKYIAPVFRDLDELFYVDWAKRYAGYRFWDAANFPPNWEINEDLAFSSPPVEGPSTYDH